MRLTTTSPARRWHRALAPVLALAAILVAGCGTPPTASPIGSASSAPPSPAGATPLPAGSFTFELPDGWQSVPVDGDHGDMVASLAETNAAFAESLEARLANLPDSATFAAFDGSRDAVASGDVVTLTVTEVDLPAGTSLETFARTVQTQVEQLVESEVELQPIVVTAGQAYSLAYLAPLTRPDGEPGTIAVTQVLYVLPGRGYVLTFGVPPERANDYAQLVAEIATSFAITI